MKRIMLMVLIINFISGLVFGMSKPHAPAIDTALAFEKGLIKKVAIQNVITVGVPADEDPTLQLRNVSWFPNSHEVLVIYWDGVNPMAGKDKYRVYKYNHQKASWNGYFSESASGNNLRPVFLSREKIVFEKQYVRTGIKDKIKANEYVSFEVGGEKKYMNKTVKVESNADTVLIQSRFGTDTVFIRQEKEGKGKVNKIYIKNLSSGKEWLAATGGERPVFLPGGKTIGFTYTKKKEEILCFYNMADPSGLLKTIKISELLDKMPDGTSDINILSIDSTNKELLFTYKNAENTLCFGYFTLSEALQ